MHSISHAFIKTAGEISGLEDTSLTEVILLETTSIFIYAQTSQGTPLGALSGMIETNYYNFLQKALEETKTVFLIRFVLNETTQHVVLALYCQRFAANF